MIEVIDDPLPEMLCISSHKARMMCVNDLCQNHSFICLREDCEPCEKNHLYCQVYRVQTMVEQLKGKRQKANPQVVKACDLMKKYYDNSIERISTDKELIGTQMELYGLNENEALFYRMLKEQRLSEITGKIGFQALEKIKQKLQLNITEESVQRYWIKRKKDFDKLFDNFKKLLQKKFIKLESKVTEEIDVIESFFEKPIYQFKLLYRASENNFQTSTFHQKCDGVANTLILAKTQFGKIIGGFTPLKWSSSGTYVNDTIGTEKTFLFSVSLNEKYDVINETYTIYGNASYGPTFGGGHDFYIANLSSTSESTSYFNFPHSYNCKGKYTSGQESYAAFSGSTNGNYYAKVDEWEVFEVEFI